METGKKVNSKILAPQRRLSLSASDRAALRRPPSKALLGVLFLVALALLPALPGIVRAIGLEVFLPRRAAWLVAGVPAPCVFFAAGFFVFALFFVFRRVPPVSYVAVHEATHALFGLLSGAKVSRLKIGKDAGSVDISRRNAAILLAPYFFPLPLAGVLAAFGATRPIPAFGGDTAIGVFAAVAGVAWGFHFCWTVNALLQYQTDLDAYGFFFSTILLLVLNAFALWLAVVVLCGAAQAEAWSDLARTVADTYLWTLDAINSR
ncbi:MAG: hypothetical protein IJS46_03680 [Kiritimatiellae bacterium]|nr:hypothetical protein [Kiritimatiellia bacterium]